MTGNWVKLKRYIGMYTGGTVGDFNVGIGSALLALLDDQHHHFLEILDALRRGIAKSLSTANTISLQACHDAMLKLHVITEVEMISGVGVADDTDLPMLVTILERRLDVVGAFLSDKQYILGLRRATMQLTRYET